MPETDTKDFFRIFFHYPPWEQMTAIKHHYRYCYFHTLSYVCRDVLRLENSTQASPCYIIRLPDNVTNPRPFPTFVKFHDDEYYELYGADCFRGYIEHNSFQYAVSWRLNSPVIQYFCETII